MAHPFAHDQFSAAALAPPRRDLLLHVSHVPWSGCLCVQHIGWTDQDAIWRETHVGAGMSEMGGLHIGVTSLNDSYAVYTSRIHGRVRVNLALHPSGVAKLSTSFGWGKNWNRTNNFPTISLD